MKKLTGEIALRLVENKDIMAGIIGVARNIEKNTIEECTITGLNREGQWLFEGTKTKGAFDDKTQFCTIVVSSEDHRRIYPIKHAQWKKAIAAKLSDDKEVTFSLQPLQFTPGNYHHECDKCTIVFVAHKKQHTCSGCCTSHGYAIIEYVKKNSTLTSRKGTLPPIAEKLTASIARKAYEMGRQCVKKEEFESWLKKVI